MLEWLRRVTFSLRRNVAVVTRPARRWAAGRLYSGPPPPFDHLKAQEFELAHNKQTIAQSSADLLQRSEAEHRANGLWHGPQDPWFGGDSALWTEFVNHVRARACLEIGCGPCGWLAPCHWIEKRILIDPLIDQYRAFQLEITGRTFFSDQVIAISAPAETLRGDLVGKIDGVIVCRNALDHCEDPLAVLANIARYAAGGSYLLLWTDIWHFRPADLGHRSITRSRDAMDGLLEGLGFTILRRPEAIRGGELDYLEYGALARKR